MLRPFGFAQSLPRGNRGDAQYFYRLWKRPTDLQDFQSEGIFTFHTQRGAGTLFTFVVQADSHLDEQSVPELYETTLANKLDDMPDFVVDLGDTFMSDKVRPETYEALEQRYRLQRSFFSLLCHSVPLFLVLGNHDGEAGWELDGTADNHAVWSTLFRKHYFPICRKLKTPSESMAKYPTLIALNSVRARTHRNNIHQIQMIAGILSAKK